MTIEHDKEAKDALDGLPLEAIPWLKARADAMTAGHAIRVYRKCEDWTLDEAATKLGVSAQMLSAYERGLRLPSVENAMRIASALGLSGLYLVQLVLRDQLRRAGLNYTVRLTESEHLS